MVKAFSDWQRYDKNRKQLMKVELETILKQERLSKDVREIVSKSLHN
jgi:aminopeptidase N